MSFKTQAADAAAYSPDLVLTKNHRRPLLIMVNTGIGFPIALRDLYGIGLHVLSQLPAYRGHDHRITVANNDNGDVSYPDPDYLVDKTRESVIKAMLSNDVCIVSVSSGTGQATEQIRGLLPDVLVNATEQGGRVVSTLMRVATKQGTYKTLEEAQRTGDPLAPSGEDGLNRVRLADRWQQWFKNELTYCREGKCLPAEWRDILYGLQGIRNSLLLTVKNTKSYLVRLPESTFTVDTIMTYEKAVRAIRRLACRDWGRVGDRPSGRYSGVWKMQSLDIFSDWVRAGTTGFYSQEAVVIDSVNTDIGPSEISQIMRTFRQEGRVLYVIADSRRDYKDFGFDETLDLSTLELPVLD